MPTDSKLRPVKWDFDIFRKEFIPRTEPRTVPVPSITDSTTYCMSFNALWMPHILGALELLLQKDSWAGGDDEIFRAQQEIYRMLANVGFCGDGDTMRIVELRAVTADGCNQNQWKYTDEPNTEWRDLGVPICPGDDGINGAPGASGECPECPPVSSVPAEETIPPTVDRSCGGAYGVIQELLEILNYNIDQAELAGSLTSELINLLTLNFKTTLEAIPVIGTVISAVEFIFFNGIEIVRSAIQNPLFDDEMACLLYCAVDLEGAFNPNSYASWVAEMKAIYSLSSGEYAFVDLVDRVLDYATISRLFAVESLNDDNRCAAGCECTNVWSWSYASTACVYNLPDGWSLDIISGACGDGVGVFNGINSYGGSSSALVDFTVSTGGATIAKVIVTTMRNVGPEIPNGGSLTVTCGAFTQTVAPVVGGDGLYEFIVNQVGDVVISLSQTNASPFNGVNVPALTIEYN